METTTLGRTGLSVSVAGLGCGGHSRLGQGYGNSAEQSIAVVRAAMDAGVNFIDTAAVYGTEEIVGRALKSDRHKAVISTKRLIVRPGTSPLGMDLLSAAEFEQLAHESFGRLDTDYIDIFHLHGVMPNQYDYCMSELVPVLDKMRDQGKIRFFGLTERFIHDTKHEMLQRALRDECWDVVMTGFNLINQSARDRVFAASQAKNVGTLVMFAVRRALSSPEAVIEIVESLISAGAIDADLIDRNDPLGFLTQPSVATSVIEAAYRYCRHEPGADIVLTGTGSIDHLLENLNSIQKPPLPPQILAKLSETFGKVDTVSGN